MVGAKCRKQPGPNDRPGCAGSHDSVATVHQGIGTVGVRFAPEVSTHLSGPIFLRGLRLQIVRVAGADAPRHQHECIGFCPASRRQQGRLRCHPGDNGALPKLSG